MFNLAIYQWTKDNLIELLNHCGYSGDDIISAEYVDTTNHSSKFRISYPDDYEDDGIGHGFVYVFIDAAGSLAADY